MVPISECHVIRRTSSRGHTSWARIVAAAANILGELEISGLATEETKVIHRSRIRVFPIISVLAATLSLGTTVVSAAATTVHDVVIRNAVIYDGSGGKPFAGEVAIDGDRIAYVGPPTGQKGLSDIDARGRAVSPGFIDMMGHSEESLLIDGRAVSGLKQGVTLDIFDEFSEGPLTPAMVQRMVARQGEVKYAVTWTTLGQYLALLQRRGIAPNVASFVGEGEVRVNMLGEADVAPTPLQLSAMRTLVRKAMEEGALGVTTALIYAPMNYAKTPELIAMAQESARCGGIYTAHMRSEGDHIEEAIQETIDIARASGAPAEIHHLKLMGQRNWGKLSNVIEMINSARASGIRITADMYTYTAGATSLDAALPPWVHDGGPEAMVARLKDPSVRARVVAAMREQHPQGWENLFLMAGSNGMLILAVKNSALKPLVGKTIADLAKMRRLSPEDTVIDLVIEDGAGELVAYTIINEDNIPREIVLPWVSFGSDAESSAPEDALLPSAAHPRAYGNFARIFAKYVREEGVLSVEEAVRKLTTLPADVLSLADRGRLRSGAFADIVIFDASTFQDHSTYANPRQFASGVSDVFINGKLALKAGEPTGIPTGRVVRGRAWKGIPGGGCRASSKDWTWIDQPPRSEAR
jgi:N-acyl-D-amino-acid deacylase